MEEEGLKDEEVMDVVIFSLAPDERLCFLYQVSFGAREAFGPVTGV